MSVNASEETSTLLRSSSQNFYYSCYAYISDNTKIVAVLKAVLMKTSVLWYMTLCRLM